MFIYKYTHSYTYIYEYVRTIHTRAAAAAATVAAGSNKKGERQPRDIVEAALCLNDLKEERYNRNPKKYYIKRPSLMRNRGTCSVAYLGCTGSC